MNGHLLVKIAKQYIQLGLAVVPTIKKTPSVRWRDNKYNTINNLNLSKWHIPQAEIAVLCGVRSRYLELLDFDDWETWLKFLDLVEAKGLQELLVKMVIIKTPSSGVHMPYRCDCDVVGNRKLAMRWGEKPKQITLIESRGEGGLLIAPCHLDNGRRFIRGDFSVLPMITEEERASLWALCISLNEVDGAVSEVIPKANTSNTALVSHTSGEMFETYQEWWNDCKRRKYASLVEPKIDWEDILEPLDWTKAKGYDGGKELWVRPGKSEREGISATTNYDGCGLLYVFSSNAAPLEMGKAYNKFCAYAILHCGGDKQKAAAELREREI